MQSYFREKDVCRLRAVILNWLLGLRSLSLAIARSGECGGLLVRGRVIFGYKLIMDSSVQTNHAKMCAHAPLGQLLSAAFNIIFSLVLSKLPHPSAIARSHILQNSHDTLIPLFTMLPC